MRKLQRLIPWAILSFLVFPENTFAWCAMCRKALEEANPGFIRGIYWSILLLTGIPLVVFLVCAYYYFRLKRRVRSLD